MKPRLVFFETSSIGAGRRLQPLFPSANPIDELDLDTAPRPYPILNPDLVQDVPQLPWIMQLLTSNQVKLSFDLPHQEKHLHQKVFPRK